MKIYVITKGCYSNYHICAVETDYNKAKQLLKKYNDSYDKAEIEIFDTDNNVLILQYKYVYSCWYNKITQKLTVTRTDFDYLDVKDYKVQYNNHTKMYYVHVNADTEEDALKIASDMIAQYRAEKDNL